MAVAETEVARKDAGRVVVRSGAVRLRWVFDNLTSSDGHTLRAVLSAAVQPVDDAAERRLLEEAFLTKGSAVSAADVAQFFGNSLEPAARRAAGAGEAASLLADAGRNALLNNLIDTAKGVAFGCGLEVLPPFELELDSPTLRIRQQEIHRSAIQTERLNRTANLIKQFQEFRATAPQLAAGEILQRIAPVDPAEQAEMMRALLQAGAQDHAGMKLWAVAGPHLIAIDSASENAGSEILSPPAALGPFRSVQKAVVESRTVLLIGARSGVLVVDPTKPQEAATYADAATVSQLGFNAAAVAGGRLWATHGESGLVGWDLETGDKPSVSVRQANVSFTPFAPRCLCALDQDRLICASGNRLLEISAAGAVREIGDSSPAPIISILAMDGGDVCVVHEDGEMCRRDRSQLAVVSRARRCGRLTAASVLPWMGSVRLLLAGDDGSVLCVGLDDELVSQYFNPYSGMRFATVAAAADRVAAVSADRQRILLWPSWDGRKPANEIHVPSLARHRVADVEFA